MRTNDGAIAAAAHLDIDARDLRIGVSHHILDRLDIYALFDHQRPERVPQRMCRYLRMRDADAGEALLDYTSDRLPHEPVVALRLVGYEERSVAVEVPIGDILLQPRDRVWMQYDDLVLVRASLALDMKDRLPLALGEVADVDTLYLAGMKPVEEHQRDHQSVAASDDSRGIDAVQQPERLLCRQRQFAVLRMAFAAADPCGDIVVIALSLAKAVKQLEDRNEAVHGIDTLTFGLQLLFVLQDVPTLWRTGIDIVRRQPPEPQRDFAPIVPFVAGISHSEIHSEMIPFRFRGVRIVVEVYDKNAGSTNQFSNNRSLPYSICNNLFEVSAPPARFTS